MHSIRGYQSFLRVTQMGDLFFTNREDYAAQLRIAPFEKMQLIIEVTMHRSFYGSCHGPYALATEKRCQKTK